MLNVSELHVSIQSIGILRNVSLAIAEGQIAGLVGRNGAGKTTLMRSVMGLLPCQRGAIEFCGQDLRRLPVHLRARVGIGYMPEDRRLIPALTVEENILAPVWAAGRNDGAAQLARIYQMMPEVEAFAGRKALQLSGGQQKLVALARALMCGIRLLMLDEPFEGVAPVLARRLAEVIAGLKREGLTVLVSESDLQHSVEMIDRVFIIERGEVFEPERRST